VKNVKDVKDPCSKDSKQKSTVTKTIYDSTIEKTYAFS